MTWLLAHMWIVVAATGLIATVLGWSIRGTLLSGKMRQSIVERDMVKVELSNSRDEVERLFAQIKKLSNGDAAAAAASDPILSRKVESLTAELARKSAEMEALKATPAPAAAAAPAGDKGEDPLVWRNRHLESRVLQLEADLAKVPAVVPATAAAPAAAAEAGPDIAKKDWEIGYLRTRVDALQNELSLAPVAAAPAVPAGASPPAAAGAVDAESAAPVEEEISRLRWRVRFLEGRLAYFEGDSAAGGAGAAPRASEAILGQLEAADELADAGADAGAQIERVRPVALDKPVNGTPDDLTLIGGIGPKIRDVLNSLGIFHFDQIADWAPENIAWVDEYLSFSGRITREGWVEQAAVLVGEAAEA